MGQIRVPTADGQYLDFAIAGDKPDPHEQQQIDGHVQQYNSLIGPPPNMAKPKEELGPWGAGWKNMYADVETAGAGLLQGLGAKDTAKNWYEDSQKIRQDVQDRYHPIDLYDIGKGGGMGKFASDAGQFVYEQGVGSLPYVIPAMASGLGAEFAALGMLGKGAEATAGLIGRGAFFAADVPAFIGQTAQRQIEEQKIPFEKVDWLKATAAGAAEATLDMITPEALGVFGELSFLSKRGSKEATKAIERWAIRIPKAMLKSALLESGTESLQQAIEIWQANPEKFYELGPDVRKELITAAVAGGVLGPMFEGVGAGRGHLEDLNKKREAARTELQRLKDTALALEDTGDAQAAQAAREAYSAALAREKAGENDTEDLGIGLTTPTYKPGESMGRYRPEVMATPEGIPLGYRVAGPTGETVSEHASMDDARMNAQTLNASAPHSGSIMETYPVVPLSSLTQSTQEALARKRFELGQSSLDANTSLREITNMLGDHIAGIERERLTGQAKAGFPAPTPDATPKPVQAAPTPTPAQKAVQPGTTIPVNPNPAPVPPPVAPAAKATEPKPLESKPLPRANPEEPVDLSGLSDEEIARYLNEPVEEDFPGFAPGELGDFAKRRGNKSQGNQGTPVEDVSESIDQPLPPSPTGPRFSVEPVDATSVGDGPGPHDVFVNGKKVNTMPTALAARNRAQAILERNTTAQVRVRPKNKHYAVNEYRGSQGGDTFVSTVRTFRDKAEAQRHADELNQRREAKVQQKAADKEAIRIYEDLVAKQQAVVKRMTDRLKALGGEDLKFRIRTVLEDPMKGGADPTIEGYFDAAAQTIALAIDIAPMNMTEDELYTRLAGVVDHEFVHVLQRAGAFTKTEWKRIIRYLQNNQAVERDGTQIPGQTWWDRAAVMYPRGKNDTDESYNYRVAKEAMSEAFRVWAKNKKAVTGEPAGIFRRIVEILKAIFQFANNDKRVSQIFKEIDEGKRKWNINNLKRTDAEAAKDISHVKLSRTGTPADISEKDYEDQEEERRLDYSKRVYESKSPDEVQRLFKQNLSKIHDTKKEIQREEQQSLEDQRAERAAQINAEMEQRRQQAGGRILKEGEVPPPRSQRKKVNLLSPQTRIAVAQKATGPEAEMFTFNVTENGKDAGRVNAIVHKSDPKTVVIQDGLITVNELTPEEKQALLTRLSMFIKSRPSKLESVPAPDVDFSRRNMVAHQTEREDDWKGTGTVHGFSLSDGDTGETIGHVTGRVLKDDPKTLVVDTLVSHDGQMSSLLTKAVLDNIARAAKAHVPSIEKAVSGVPLVPRFLQNDRGFLDFSARNLKLHRNYAEKQDDGTEYKFDVVHYEEGSAPYMVGYLRGIVRNSKPDEFYVKYASFPAGDLNARETLGLARILGEEIPEIYDVEGFRISGAKPANRRRQMDIISNKYALAGENLKTAAFKHAFKVLYPDTDPASLTETQIEEIKDSRPFRDYYYNSPERDEYRKVQTEYIQMGNNMSVMQRVRIPGKKRPEPARPATGGKSDILLNALNDTRTLDEMSRDIENLRDVPENGGSGDIDFSARNLDLHMVHKYESPGYKSFEFQVRHLKKKGVFGRDTYDNLGLLRGSVFSDRPNTFQISWAGFEPRDLKPRETLALARMLAKQVPGITEVEGGRVSGAKAENLSRRANESRDNLHALRTKMSRAVLEEATRRYKGRTGETNPDQSDVRGSEEYYQTSVDMSIPEVAAYHAAAGAHNDLISNMSVKQRVRIVPREIAKDDGTLDYSARNLSLHLTNHFKGDASGYDSYEFDVVHTDGGQRHVVGSLRGSTYNTDPEKFYIGWAGFPASDLTARETIALARMLGEKVPGITKVEGGRISGAKVKNRRAHLNEMEDEYYRKYDETRDRLRQEVQDRLDKGLISDVEAESKIDSISRGGHPDLLKLRQDHELAKRDYLNSTSTTQTVRIPKAVAKDDGSIDFSKRNLSLHKRYSAEDYDGFTRYEFLIKHTPVAGDSQVVGSLEGHINKDDPTHFRIGWAEFGQKVGDIPKLSTMETLALAKMLRDFVPSVTWVSGERISGAKAEAYHARETELARIAQEKKAEYQKKFNDRKNELQVIHINETGDRVYAHTQADYNMNNKVRDELRTSPELKAWNDASAALLDWQQGRYQYVNQKVRIAPRKADPKVIGREEIDFSRRNLTLHRDSKNETEDSPEAFKIMKDKTERVGEVKGHIDPDDPRHFRIDWAEFEDGEVKLTPRETFFLAQKIQHLLPGITRVSGERISGARNDNFYRESRKLEAIMRNKFITYNEVVDAEMARLMKEMEDRGEEPPRESTREYWAMRLGVKNQVDLLPPGLEYALALRNWHGLDRMAMANQEVKLRKPSRNVDFSKRESAPPLGPYLAKIKKAYPDLTEEERYAAGDDWYNGMTVESAIAYVARRRGGRFDWDSPKVSKGRKGKKIDFSQRNLTLHVAHDYDAIHRRYIDFEVKQDGRRVSALSGYVSKTDPKEFYVNRADNETDPPMTKAETLNLLRLIGQHLPDVQHLRGMRVSGAKETNMQRRVDAAHAKYDDILRRLKDEMVEELERNEAAYIPAEFERLMREVDNNKSPRIMALLRKKEVEIDKLTDLGNYQQKIRIPGRALPKEITSEDGDIDFSKRNLELHKVTDTGDGSAYRYISFVVKHQGHPVSNLNTRIYRGKPEELYIEWAENRMKPELTKAETLNLLKKLAPMVPGVEYLLGERISGAKVTNFIEKEQALLAKQRAELRDLRDELETKAKEDFNRGVINLESYNSRMSQIDWSDTPEQDFLREVQSEEWNELQDEKDVVQRVPIPERFRFPEITIDYAARTIDTKLLKKTGRKPGGSADGYLAEGPDGQKYLVKFYNSDGQAAQEVLAANLYALAGVPSAQMSIVTGDTRLGVASLWTPGNPINPRSDADIKGVRAGIAVDAWMANWDTVGLDFDNILNVDGHYVRIDPGGSLDYRAQGDLKGSRFGDEVIELDGLRNPGLNPQASMIYGRMTTDEIGKSINSLGRVSDSAIRAMIDAHLRPYQPGRVDELADKMVARKNWLLAWQAKNAPDTVDYAKRRNWSLHFVKPSVAVSDFLVPHTVTSPEEFGKWFLGGWRREPFFAPKRSQISYRDGAPRAMYHGTRSPGAPKGMDLDQFKNLRPSEALARRDITFGYERFRMHEGLGGAYIGSFFSYAPKFASEWSGQYSETDEWDNRYNNYSIAQLNIPKMYRVFMSAQNMFDISKPEHQAEAMRWIKEEAAKRWSVSNTNMSNFGVEQQRKSFIDRWDSRLRRGGDKLRFWNMVDDIVVKNTGNEDWFYEYEPYGGSNASGLTYLTLVEATQKLAGKDYDEARDKLHVPPLYSSLLETDMWQEVEDIPNLYDFLKQAGFDGFYVSETGMKNVSVIHPEQIKSVHNPFEVGTAKQVDMSRRGVPTGSTTRPLSATDIANVNDRLRYTRVRDMFKTAMMGGTILGRKIGLSEMTATKAANWFIDHFQDHALSLGELVDKVRDNKGSIPDTFDAYLQQQLWSSRATSHLERLHDSLYQPMFRAIRSVNFSDKDFEDFKAKFPRLAKVIAASDERRTGLVSALLYARHAPERNAVINIMNNGKLPDGSGLSTAEAEAAIKWFERRGDWDKLRQAENIARKIINETNDIRVKFGLTPDFRNMPANKTFQKAGLPNGYKFYVPLRGMIDEDEMPNDIDLQRLRTGAGFKIKGKEDMTALGRNTMADRVIEHVILQNEVAVARAHKNVVGNSFYGLVKNNPDTVGKIARIVEKAPVIRRLGDDGTVKLMVDPQYQNNDQYFVTKVNGENVVIELFDARLAKTLNGSTGYGDENIMKVVNFIGGFTRLMSQLATGLNPEFWMRNAPRDLATAGININQYEIPGLSGRLAANWTSSFAAVRRANRFNWQFVKSGDEQVHQAMNDDDRLYQDFLADGGFTGYLGLHDIETRTIEMNKQITKGEQQGLQKGLGVMKRFANFVEGYNNVFENATRFAVYKTMIEAGLSRERAAQAAKTVTTNFNAGGWYKGMINPFYMFYNASLQGTFGILTAGMRSKKVRKIVGSIVVAGILQDLIMSMASDRDDDGTLKYDKVQEYIHQNYMVFMDPTGTFKDPFIKIPMPYGYNAVFNFGRVLAKYARHTATGGDFTLAKATSSAVGTLVDATNPLGATNSFLNFVAPTILDPVVDLTTNKDFADRTIVKRPSQLGVEMPSSQLHLNSTDPTFVNIAEWLNSVTGGTDVMPGGIDFSPDALQYLFDYFLSGAGTFARRTVNLGTGALPAVLQGDFDQIDMNEIPMARAVFGRVDDKANTAKFMEIRDNILQIGKELEDASQKQDMDRIRSARERYAKELQVYPLVKQANSQRNSIVKRIAAINENEKLSPVAKENLLKQLKEQEQTVQDRAVKAYNSVVEGLPTRP